MSKGLEAFYELLSPIGMSKEGIKKFHLIEKELKALEIINKVISVRNDKISFDFQKFIELDDRECDLLKEVLKDD